MAKRITPLEEYVDGLEEGGITGGAYESGEPNVYGI